MKILLNALFVYIPIGFFVLLQLLFLAALYGPQGEGAAPIAKWAIPVIIIVAVTFHVLKLKKNGTRI